MKSKKTIFWDDLSEDPTICYFDCAFASDFGWRSSWFSKWEWGQPTCGSLTGGHTGPNAISYNSDGYYDSNMFPVSLLSPIIDCSAYENVTLEFWRWLEVEQNLFDNAKVEVSNGDGIWHTVWSNPNSTILDTEWTKEVIDISAWAGKQSFVTIRWVMGATDSDVEYCGWNIDDIRITGQ
ncbi:MAG: immune inhibitor A [Desulfocapsa sp.]|nr:immune inhibitor A [Desulfocapsa sp.]